jgi:hypothetical protein
MGEKVELLYMKNVQVRKKFHAFSSILKGHIVKKINLFGKLDIQKKMAYFLHLLIFCNVMSSVGGCFRTILPGTFHSYCEGLR